MIRRLTTPELLAGLMLAVSLPSPSALAAPFCLQTETVPPQCIYYDAANCRRDATRQRGFCVVDGQEIALRPGTGAYCLVTGDGASVCDFQDPGPCTQEATRQNAVCVLAPPAAAGNIPNPYQYLPSADQASQGTNRP